jgi:hypothetical protein
MNNSYSVFLRRGRRRVFPSPNHLLLDDLTQIALGHPLKHALDDGIKQLVLGRVREPSGKCGL